jgi:hypothetical protein
MLGRNLLGSTVPRQLRPGLQQSHLIRAAAGSTYRTRMAAAKTALDEMEKGEFKRTAAGFRYVV